MDLEGKQKKQNKTKTKCIPEKVELLERETSIFPFCAKEQLRFPRAAANQDLRLKFVSLFSQGMGNLCEQYRISSISDGKKKGLASEALFDSREKIARKGL